MFNTFENKRDDKSSKESILNSNKGQRMYKKRTESLGKEQIKSEMLSNYSNSNHLYNQITPNIEKYR